MEEIVHNRMSADGMCDVKLVSDREISPARMLRLVPVASVVHAKVNCYPTTALSLFYGEVTFPARQVVTLNAECWRKPRRFAVWRLMQEDGLRVSEVIEHLADWFFVQTHHRPGYAYMKSLPSGVESGQELNGVMLMEAEWALDQCVMVGG